jgi:hypothetical protein
MLRICYFGCKREFVYLWINILLLPLEQLGVDVVGTTYYRTRLHVILTILDSFGRGYPVDWPPMPKLELEGALM